MTQEEAMQFWFTRINFEQRSAQPGDLKLDRMRLLLHLLGNPQRRLRILHVTGSKGKGSTSAMLASVLRQAGFRVGLFTSPHLSHVNERIQLDQQPISDLELTALLSEIRDTCGDRLYVGTRLVDALTFFEIGTALGFLHFLRRRSDFVVLEVGLGGRFDSTNVCLPLVSIITSISIDHTQQLGPTEEAIAFEKAGIVKARRPTVSGVPPGAAADVIARVCHERASPLIAMGRDFQYSYEAGVLGASADRLGAVSVTTGKCEWRDLELGLLGEFQAANAAVAIATLECLREQGVTISEQAVRRGLRQVDWPARLEVVGRHPLVLLDCAHNVASAQALVCALAASVRLTSRGRRWLIFAGSRDKDLSGMLSILVPSFDQVLLTRFRNSARFTPPEQLLALVPADPQGRCQVCANVSSAWGLARREAHPDDLICAAGSVFLAGDLRELVMSR